MTNNNTQDNIIKVKVEAEAPGRLDKYLAEKVQDLSRTRIQQFIKDSLIRVNGKVEANISYKLGDGDEIEISVPREEPLHLMPKKIDFEIVYDDPHLMVINKPAGLTVHPGAGNSTDTLVNALLAHNQENLSTIGGEMRPGIVHRIDKNTSGLLIIAKNNIVHAKLSELLQNREIKRTYWAIVWKVPQKFTNTIDINIGRSRINRKKMGVVHVGGKNAITHYKVIKILKDKVASLLECQLETGRTHQIRVHLSHSGHSIVGDTEYGNMRGVDRSLLTQETKEFLTTFNRQALHAKKLEFVHPITHKLIDLETELPEDMSNLLRLLSE